MSGLSPHEPFLVTFFTDHAAGRKYETMVELEDLARRVRMMNGSSKATLPWLKFARFGDKKTAKGSLRHDQNMISISGIEADYDGEIMSFGQAYDLARSAGLLCLVYTSPSHSEDGPRWRVLCPLSREYTPDERDRFLGRLNGLFGGMFAPESWTLSQSYYYGSVNHNPSHRAEVARGEPIDLLDALDIGAIGRPVKSKTNGATHHGPATPPGMVTDKRIRALFESQLAHISAAADGAKYSTMRDIAFAIGGRLHLSNWSDVDVVEACMIELEKCSSPVKDWNHARKNAAEAVAAGRLRPMPLENRPNPNAKNNGAHPPPYPHEDVWARDIPPIELPDPEPETEVPVVEVNAGGMGPDPPTPTNDGGGGGGSDGKPVIPCIAGEMPRMVRQAEAALLKAGVEIYQRHKLVRPIEEEYPAADQRVTHSAALLAFTPASLFNLLSEVAEFRKYNARAKAFVTCDPPDRLVQVMLDGKGDWTFPHIRGVLTCPTLRFDGSVLKDRGYDPVSRFYLAMPSDLTMPPMPDTPTRADAEAAIERLDGLMERFPFVDAVSKSVAFCILMTQVLRCAMQVSPMLAVSATAPSSGKSFLVDLASAIALGRPCPVIPPGKNEEETEKGIRTKLISGTPAFSIDNIHNGINMPLLNLATSATFISIRLFSVLEEVEVENSVVIYATGNNLEIIDEQGRRTMRCCLDSGEERPEYRVFDVNPIDTVMADRGRYIADILTIARAYLCHIATGGKRPDIHPMGDSHKTWSKLVREPLVWLNREDPLKSQEITREDDPVSSRLAAIIEAWHAAFDLEPRTLGEAGKYATSPPTLHAGYDKEYFQHKERQEGLLAALRDGFAAGRDGVNTHAWGNWMRRFAGRVSGGFRFERAKEADTKHKGGGGHWKVVKT